MMLEHYYIVLSDIFWDMEINLNVLCLKFYSCLNRSNLHYNLIMHDKLLLELGYQHQPTLFVKIGNCTQSYLESRQLWLVVRISAISFTCLRESK